MQHLKCNSVFMFWIYELNFPHSFLILSYQTLSMEKQNKNWFLIHIFRNKNYQTPVAYMENMQVSLLVLLKHNKLK